MKSGASGGILVVDDDPNVAGLFASALEREGYAVRVAHDGESALRLSGAESPGLVILDLLLPKPTGFDLAQHWAGEIPVIAVSGVYRDDRARAQMAALGVHELLEKPVDPALLLERVRALAGPPGFPPRARPPLVRKEPKRASSEGREPEAAAADGMRTARGRPENGEAVRLGAAPSAMNGRLAGWPEAGTVDPTGRRTGTIQRRGEFVEVLGTLHRLGSTGALLLARGSIKKMVHFRAGTPMFVRSNLLSECLGRLMVAERLVPEDACEEALARKKRSGQRIGETLIEMGLISESNLEFALEQQMQLKLRELFAWGEGQWQFIAGPQNAQEVELGVKPALLAHEALKAHLEPPELVEAVQPVGDLRMLPLEAPELRSLAEVADAEALRRLDATGPTLVTDFVHQGDGDRASRATFVLALGAMGHLEFERDALTEGAAPPSRSGGTAGAEAKSPAPLEPAGSRPGRVAPVRAVSLPRTRVNPRLDSEVIGRGIALPRRGPLPPPPPDAPSKEVGAADAAAGPAVAPPKTVPGPVWDAATRASDLDPSSSALSSPFDPGLDALSWRRLGLDLEEPRSSPLGPTEAPDSLSLGKSTASGSSSLGVALGPAVSVTAPHPLEANGSAQVPDAPPSASARRAGPTSPALSYDADLEGFGPTGSEPVGPAPSGFADESLPGAPLTGGPVAPLGSPADLLAIGSDAAGGPSPRASSRPEGALKGPGALPPPPPEDSGEFTVSEVASSVEADARAVDARPAPVRRADSLEAELARVREADPYDRLGLSPGGALDVREIDAAVSAAHRRLWSELGAKAQSDGRSAHLFDAVAMALEDARADLLHPDAARRAAGEDVASLAWLEALEAFEAGLEAAWTGDLLTAGALFSRAARLDPKVEDYAQHAAAVLGTKAPAIAKSPSASLLWLVVRARAAGMQGEEAQAVWRAVLEADPDQPEALAAVKRDDVKGGLWGRLRGS